MKHEMKTTSSIFCLYQAYRLTFVPPCEALKNYRTVKYNIKATTASPSIATTYTQKGSFPGF